MTETEPLPPAPEVRPSHRSELWWIAADGERVPLTGDMITSTSGIIAQRGVHGLEAPPVDLRLDELPLLDGAVFRHVRSPVRDIFLPLLLWATDREAMVLLKRHLIHRMNPRNGRPGTLEVVETDSVGARTSRYIDCFYVSGMEGEEKDAAGLVYCKFGVNLKAPDPFWYGTEVELVDNVNGDPPLHFFTGKPRGAGDHIGGSFLPLHLSKRSDPDGKKIMSVNGDVEAWPIWIVKAHGADTLLIKHEGTKEQILLKHPFGFETDIVTIDTRPGHKTVWSQRDKNVWERLAPGSELFSLGEGQNSVLVDFSDNSGGTPVHIAGTVTVKYRPRYLAA
ncbi:phage distal tail protein [Thermomonospora umbrina]|uniref:Tail protein n=1 Tax=Thermomonospora umbrina TaxID=111806 RepID=A0A3D9SGX6_9ACTN|nr:phage tail domain-containing protein [Thermomonospora umbrina]REE95152.1 tail protein [Thermomonospora umbrina]